MRIRTTVLTLMIAFLSACSSTNKTDRGFIDNGPSGASVSGYNPYGTNTISGYGSTVPHNLSLVKTYNNSAKKILVDNNKIPFAENTIYFMFNSSEIRPEFIPIINQSINYLRANPNQTMVLEGHADERGSREYNIALGEERAISVARIMEAGGVFRGQLEFVSYGEEKPASLGHNEAAWRLNRRVNLTY